MEAAAGSGGGMWLVDASNNTWSSIATVPVAGIKNTVALGAGATANEGNNNSTAIGSGAQATGTGNGSIALGQGALAMGAGVATKDIQNETTDSAGATSAGSRSEEHTSELQSLMRISYAVFCLKKKNTINNTQSSKSQSATTYMIH